ncbi:MAG: PilZ domain-containing protein [Treponema sp.]|jgi:c-di-GMP-binding flagellar brake protein YcgR|nr:PilZ domain-containing protein [Treponema sp.]
MQGVVFFVVISLGGLLFFLSRSKSDTSASWVQFFSKGTDAGFGFKEIEILRRLSEKSQIEYPISIFTTQDQLDICIRAFVQDMSQKGQENETESQNFLAKLYDFRQRIAKNKSSTGSGISNSRQVSEGQNIQILLEGYGVFKSQVVKNTNQYLIASRPNSSKIPGVFSWLKQAVSVYFWREEDAGYVFDTEVIDEVLSRGISCLKIAHSDTLSRTQKRKSIRVKMHKPAFLYPLKREADASKIETMSGLKCFLEDLSDTGCAITVGGKGEPGLRIKAQFALNSAPIVMTGTVRSVQHKADINNSLLHIEADPLPIDIRNQILGGILGMLPEDEEDLPYRILNEEAKEAADHKESEGAEMVDNPQNTFAEGESGMEMKEDITDTEEGGAEAEMEEFIVTQQAS